ncbi:NDR1/HIN1-like protein [Thalictrum thalictroides]|uniref:NDR1/HIN1-like protein n=1 Tax=Thalictrum thalictroides TaxID=46969 RepID=A0A7J6WBM2_THATH|nr:NDR1/HIN1-like protein [Thalictrum thalictroides]
MSAKDCGNHGSSKKRLYRRLFAAFLTFIILVLFVILLVWLILRPTKPRFTLQEATVYQFNITGNNMLTSYIQVTIASKNPNDRIGIYYDRLDTYATYRGQQITLASSIPSTYQGHDDINIWSPYLTGNSEPIAPFLATNLAQDQMAGQILIYVKLDGRVRWKVGSWISGRYHLFVNCPAYLTFGSKFSGVSVGGSVVNADGNMIQREEKKRDTHQKVGGRKLQLRLVSLALWL